MQKYLFVFLLILNFAIANVMAASFRPISKLSSGRIRVNDYISISSSLVDQGLYYTAVPFVKEYLLQAKIINNRRVDKVIDQIVGHVGVKQFELLPIEILSKSSAPTLQFILGKKLFRKGKYKRSQKILESIGANDHAIKPFVLLLLGSIKSLNKEFNSSVSIFKKCVELSNRWIDKTQNKNKKRQLEITRDSCIVGIPRSQFANKKFADATLSYLDLPKSSHIWPEILFEEAWNSFYQRNYNRTLGKLVTYKAPVFNYYFNPEIDILRALTYLELCLWGDTKKTVDDFYKKYQRDSVVLARLLNKRGTDYKYFYLLGKKRRGQKVNGGKLLNNLLKSVIKDPTFINLYNQFLEGKSEVNTLKTIQNKRVRILLAKNLKESLLMQRDLVGAYVRKRLRVYNNQLYRSLEGMSYIKLEVLSRKKSELYHLTDMNRSRGDIAYLERNDKQYFWSFNGEFWADELGDYVFSLTSECR